MWGDQPLQTSWEKAVPTGMTNGRCGSSLRRSPASSGADGGRPWRCGRADAPYYIPKGVDGEPVKFLQAKPRTDPGKCTNCGACARCVLWGRLIHGRVPQSPAPVSSASAASANVHGTPSILMNPAFLSHVAHAGAEFYRAQGEHEGVPMIRRWVLALLVAVHHQLVFPV